MPKRTLSVMKQSVKNFGLLLSVCFASSIFILSVFTGSIANAQPLMPKQDQAVELAENKGIEPFGLKPLTASIKKTQFLPGEMYGQWSVSGKLIKTNAPPGFFPDQTQNVWQLERSGEAVTISNPVSGASATIQVDEASGNRAVFHRVSHPRKNWMIIEVPTIVVNGNQLTGETFNQIKTFKKGTIDQDYHAVYSLFAQRLSAPSQQFKAEEESLEPFIEIAPLQPIGDL
jgi:hypothetical protein